MKGLKESSAAMKEFRIKYGRRVIPVLAEYVYTLDQLFGIEKDCPMVAVAI